METSPADRRRSGHARHPRPCPSCEAVLGFSSFPHGETERDRPRAVPVSRRDRTAQRGRRPGVSASGAHVPACPSAKKAACVPPCAAPGRGGVWGSGPGGPRWLVRRRWSGSRVSGTRLRRRRRHRSGSGQRGRAAMLRSLPLGPPPASSLRPHIQAWSEPSLLLTPPLVRASGKPCTVRHTHHKGPRVPQPPPRRGPGSGHGHPPCRNGAICFRMLITPLFLAHSIIFNILLLLLKGNIRELKA